MSTKIDSIQKEEVILKGIPASPGIAIGPAFLFQKREPVIEERSILVEDIPGEIARLEQAVAAISACKKFGLATQAFFIIGLPWETRESLSRTFKFAARLNTVFFDFNIAAALCEKQAPAFRNMKKLLRQSVADEMARREDESLGEFIEIWYSDETRAFLREIAIRE